MDLDKNLTPEFIRDKMVAQGFPAGLAITLGSSLLKQIASPASRLAMTRDP